MNMSGSLINVVTLLESYRGRDKIMRMASFGACFASGLAKSPEMKQKLMRVMTEISACRTILRLFDDLSMLSVTLKFGMGKHEKDVVQRVFGFLSNIVNQLFYPIEHIAWAAEKGLVSVSATPWWITSILAWILSLLLNIFRCFMVVLCLELLLTVCLCCLWNLVKMRYKMARIDRSSAADSSDVKLLRRAQSRECYSLIENAANLGLAVHWLPGNRLWSGKLSSTTVGVLGIVSSCIGLLKMTTLK